jgi:hypothetical protein
VNESPGARPIGGVGNARWSILASLIALAACSDEEAPKPPRTPLTVWALDEATGAGDPQMPLANVEVAFDPPGGGARVVSRTAPDGHVVFEADFTKEGGTVTVISADHVFVSALDASPATARARPNSAGKPAEDLVLVVPRLDTAMLAETIELRGALTGKTKPESIVDVSVSGVRRLGSNATREESYSLRAPRARPFFLLGHELESNKPAGGTTVNEVIKSFRLEVPAREAHGELDIDVASVPPLPLRPVRVRAPLPPGGPFGAAASCSATVQAADSTLLLGAFRRGANDGAACDLDMTVAETDIAPDTPLTTAVLVAPDGSRSVRTEPGVLADGASLDGFVLPPVIADVSRSLRDPIAVERLPPDADVRIDVFAGNQLMWVLTSPPGGLRTPTLVMPASPTRFTADITLLALTVTVQLERTVLPSGTVVHRREATSRDVIVRR